MGYKHLTREQRYTIEALLQTPISLREIREVIGVRRHYLMFTDEISLRPSIIDEKKRFGDFEIDTMIGKNRRGHHDDKRQVHASGADPQACWERSHPAGQYGNRSAATL